MTPKQRLAIEKVKKHFSQFTFFIFDKNNKLETVPIWGVCLYRNPIGINYNGKVHKPDKNGYQFAEAYGDIEIQQALKAISRAIWHKQPVW